ncbi:conserved hypothetical protein [Xanthomonas citri pv. fuscans]|uniref:hypothetical protein n=1 Tax=Xanthomonas citri TaxID=346 RepID=UPI000C3F937F|nr:hypothetical protein [Xanthomonas citri]QTF19394.1 hypothetical protein XcfCFBP6992P_23645 [Xanthomonas citri pv. phaseoli var. fuscans]QTF76459.1 hypothetical protein XcfCFBP6994P_23230 [Xanthomonas citri pv. phaseoli var. fuscans]SOO18667.1 conserved hypothetical protein [Xanthomonas citri pv. fuscans]SOO32641.1 hypothetical protein XFF6994_2040011 [Xanthomonas citri pv. fuscans]
MRDIDAIIAKLRLAYPNISVAHFAVLHPGADDDGLWFFRNPASEVEFQLESSTGACPFLAESSASAERLTADTIEQAIALVVAA